MRLAHLTDLHANREALEACLAHAEGQGVDQYAFTGDFVGYGADPGWVVRTVMAYVARGAVAVQGNHDYAVTRALRPSMHAEARETIEWTRRQLDTAQLDFLAALPLVQHHGNACFVHASAHDPARWEYVVGVAEAERSLRASRGRIVFSGHVHAPALYRRADDGRMGRHVPCSRSTSTLCCPARWASRAITTTWRPTRSSTTRRARSRISGCRTTMARRRAR